MPINRHKKPETMQLPKESIDDIVSVVDQSEAIIKRIESLENVMKDKSWPERHPFKFACFSAFMGAIAALILQKVAQMLHLL